MGWYDSLKSGVTSFVNDPFDINYRKRKARERDAAAANSAQKAQDDLESGYNTYRGGVVDSNTKFNAQQDEADRASKESMDNYRISRKTIDTQADNNRETRLGMETNMLNEGVKNVNDITNRYVSTAEKLSGDAASQAADAKQTYTDTIKPNLMNNLNDARNFQNTIAGQAMSLADAMDVNNKVAAGQRGLYNDLASQMTGRYDEMSQQERADLEGLMARGEGQFAGQVENTQKRGLADVGVLSALGAQATNLLGGNQPMTGGQMAAMMGQQGQQASEAYAQAQQRMQALEDQKRAYSLQGLQNMGDRASDLRRSSLTTEGNLRTEGIAAGTNQSNLMYDRGYQGTTEAMDRTAMRLSDLQGGETSYNDLAARLRGEQSGYSGDIYGARGSEEQFRQGVADRLFGSRSAIDEGKISRSYGNNAEDMSLINAGIGIDRGASERTYGQGRELGTLDYQHGREMSGIEQDAAANAIQTSAARDSANVDTSMGIAGLGTQALMAFLGSRKDPGQPSVAPPPQQSYNPYNPYGFSGRMNS